MHFFQKEKNATIPIINKHFRECYFSLGDLSVHFEVGPHRMCCLELFPEQ